MKNIYILPSNKPTKVYVRNDVNPPFYSNFQGKPVNIYITSDEEIKQEDWFYDTQFSLLGAQKARWDTKDKYQSKIILTTDQDLIKDGVQAIDDEFLEWFVKNSNCEYVEVKWVKTPDGIFYTNDVPYGCYKIIIPKEIDILELGQIIPKEEPKPRRNKLWLNTQAELAIFNAIQEVETVGADVRLTEIVIMLGQAKDLLSDYIDNTKDLQGTELAKKTLVKITDKLPDGVLWKKAREYSKQFTSFEKPVQSEIAMNVAQDHYYRGMIDIRDMIEHQNDEAINLLDGLVSDVGNLLCDVADLDFEWQQAGYYETAKKWLLENKS